MDSQQITVSQDLKELASNELENMFISKAFTDCAVFAQGVKFNCHRVILATASPLFKELLLTFDQQNNVQFPLLIFERLTKDNLISLLQLIYKGEVEVPKAQLQSFSETLRYFGMAMDLKPTEERAVGNSGVGMLLRAASETSVRSSRSVNSVTKRKSIGESAKQKRKIGEVPVKQERKSTDEPPLQKRKCVSFAPHDPGVEDLAMIHRRTMNSLSCIADKDIADVISNQVMGKRTEFRCKFCSKQLGSERSTKGHEKGCKQNPDRGYFYCAECKMEFSRADGLKNHDRRVHND
jgi:hypothetical protein